MHCSDIRIQQLRAHMRPHNMAAYIVPTSDYHASEYVGDHFQTRRYLTGFTGSAGTLVVTQEEALLWTDGRYFLQAEEELRGSCIRLCRSREPGTPTLEAYLERAVPENGIVGTDGRTVDAARFESLKRRLSHKGISFCCDVDLAGDVWQDRPPLSDAPIYLLEECYTGKSAEAKLAELRQVMAQKGANVHLLTSLDDIAWLFNFRGADIPFNPVALCYAVIETENAFLFIDGAKLDASVRAYFQALGVTLYPYEAIYDFCAQYTAFDTVLLNKKQVNQTLFQAVSPATVVDAPNPTTLKKSVKNPVEQENLRKAHRKDAVAMIRFLYRFKTGLLNEPVTEISAAAALDALRMEQAGCIGPSFDTISGFGAHGAIVHYHAEPAHDAAIVGNGLLLIDSGGQYFEGTTDVTRTIAIGTPDAAAKRDYTLVLKGMLRLMQARFPKGITGRHLDVLARGPLWADGLDYRHGTGHGIGAFLCVHEGPVAVNWQTAAPIPLEPGMVLSDEPGLYVQGAYGVRHENQLLCVAAGETEYGAFYAFEPLTLVPFDREALLPSLLNAEEMQWLNAYHAQVYAEIAPLLNENEQAWLRQVTQPL
ncbi:MAG: aminopeptidase P family protein [Eubacteriales bacterium]|nr:aminopeptidase P family protein [Eubacteriales bacterium]